MFANRAARRTKHCTSFCLAGTRGNAELAQNEEEKGGSNECTRNSKRNKGKEENRIGKTRAMEEREKKSRNYRARKRKRT